MRALGKEITVSAELRQRVAAMPVQFAAFALGTAAGDLTASLGLGLGLGPVTLSWTVAILGFVGYLAVSRRDVGSPSMP